MAGGLGTRMKSATPKHLHPLLGRRMVDWVIGAARDAGVDRVVVVASPDTAGLVRRPRGGRAAKPLGTGDAVRSARAALAGRDGRRARAERRRARAHVGAAALRSSTTHRAAGAAGTVLSFEPADPRAYGRIVRDARRPARANRRGGRRDPRGARARRGQLGDLRLPGRAALARCSTGSSRRTRRASSTSPTRSACSSATGRPSQCTLHPCRSTSRGSTPAWSSPPSRRRSATASTSGTCSPA